MNTEQALPSEVLNKPFTLDNSNQHNTESNETAGSNSFWTHGYSVAGLGLLLPEGIVGEVFDSLPLCRLPNTSEWLHAMASQRGNVVPIFDLAKIFGLKLTPELSNQDQMIRKYFLIGQREKTLGILIDEMPTRIFLGDEERLSSTPPLPAILQPFVNACYQADHRIWVDWDVDNFFLTVGDQV